MVCLCDESIGIHVEYTGSLTHVYTDTNTHALMIVADRGRYCWLPNYYWYKYYYPHNGVACTVDDDARTRRRFRESSCTTQN